MRAIDLFAGCGGMSAGFKQAGFKITKAVELDPVIARTYAANFPEVDLAISDIKDVDEGDFFEGAEADAIIGGPPCQGFSMAGARIRKGFIDDPRNYLFKHYYNVVKAVHPRVFVMENVKGMQSMQNGAVIREIIRLFQEGTVNCGPYYIHQQIIDASEYGIPQKRERLILVGTQSRAIDVASIWAETQRQINAEDGTFFDAVNVHDAIGNLPNPTPDGIVDNPAPQTAYQRYLACDGPTLANHSASRHSRKVVERMAQIKPGQNFTSLDENITSVHSGSYGRMTWDEPATTITTRFDTPAGGRFTHPSENRTLTHREAARIQGFNDGFTFYGDRRSISRQIGNAVPPKVAYFCGRLTANILSIS